MGVSAGMHELEVYVDNRFTEESALHIPNDYYTYGGIIRGVVLEYLPEIFIQEFCCTPVYREENWEVDIKIRLKNEGEDPQSIDGSVSIAGHTAEFSDLVIEKEGLWETVLSVSDVTNWEPENPVLYLAEICIMQEKTVIDDYIERIGFRKIEIIDNKLLLNDKEIYIKGYNRHEDHPILGCSLTFQEMEYDLNLVLKSNANLIRTSHYPNDELFLDLCDEKGILVWEESHARGLTEEKMAHPNFQKQSLECIDAMINHHKHHPSIIMWGLLNECSSNTEFGRECYRQQIKRIRELDSTRPVTFASDKHFTDLCMDLVDIVSLNIYPRWYEDKDPGEMLDEIYEWLIKTGEQEKPILISEFGAGAIYGYRSPQNEKWSEQRQCAILKECIEKFFEKSYINGIIIWQFCDCRVTEEEWALKRPKCQNNKGIVDQYRRPKMAFDTVQELFRSGRK